MPCLPTVNQRIDDAKLAVSCLDNSHQSSPKDATDRWQGVDVRIFDTHTLFYIDYIEEG